MKVAIASDFSGFKLKEAVKNHLVSLGFDVSDVGQKNETDKMLYFDASTKLSMAIQKGDCDRGIIICGTGAGSSMIVNKYKGIYCVACESVYTAEKISLINNANVIAMGQRVVSLDMGSEMAEKWLNGKWCEGFAKERRKNNENGFAVLQNIEKENFK